MRSTVVHLSYQRLNAVFWLAVASFICLSMWTARVIYIGSISYRFLVWNLFLAWIPLLCALMAERSRGPLAVACGAAWLLFFPNAPYIITDLVHLRDHGRWMFWVNLITLLSFAMTGLLLGYLSLYVMQKRVGQRFGSIAGWVFALSTLGLCSFGIYLGRFGRWNSWDVVLEPVSLLRDIWQIIRHPVGNGEVYAISALLAAFLVGMYLVLYHFARHTPDPVQPVRQPADSR
ncbi:MAG: DUF1361 domain-containing protein [Chloroflexi bacterium]|jgi:uncharacterized membrane protein|uniref:DUF1361 domain-containing protein n=1 Tax=Candidatus Thermofonsia Clade 3 bacterium TaxID=2364212 RepID=A0A2M8QFI5_9CHLR|nr:DUF1361 domain-containing protein [Candidatus Roseilinea sp. NK_OTU-006]PJF48583.1 MAG: DUF1361 domain-containing protein [Candidatus Thermofonsia Clade 3 bacterium]RMG62395.1 MAG: DUF1361 domain-containing protein [Chloroflexota bacterium]